MPLTELMMLSITDTKPKTSEKVYLEVGDVGYTRRGAIFMRNPY